jgi:predicted nucleic acid-binding protein
LIWSISDPASPISRISSEPVTFEMYLDCVIRSFGIGVADSARAHRSQHTARCSLLFASIRGAASKIWAFEIANSIFVSYSRRKRITEQQIREYLDLLKALPIRVEPQSLWANVDLESLARRRNLAVYDMAYLHLAQRTSFSLATADGPLKEAAIAEGVSVI